MGDYFYAILIQRLKDHNGGSCQGAGVQGVGQLYGSARLVGSKFRFCGDFRAIYQEGFPRALVHKNA